MDVYNTLSNWGAFTAPLLNIAGFFMIYLAFQQQNKSMALAREEFEINYQETFFFNLINLYYEHINKIQNSFQGGGHGNSNFFVHVHSYLEKSLRDNAELATLNKAYENLYRDNHRHIDPFIRHIQFILSFIREGKSLQTLSPNRRTEIQEHHLNVLKSQLSSSELQLLFYHCLCKRKEMGVAFTNIKESKLFQRLKKDKLLIHESYWDEYQKLDNL